MYFRTGVLAANKTENMKTQKEMPFDKLIEMIRFHDELSELAEKARVMKQSFNSDYQLQIEMEKVVNELHHVTERTKNLILNLLNDSKGEH